MVVVCILKVVSILLSALTIQRLLQVSNAIFLDILLDIRVHIRRIMECSELSNMIWSFQPWSLKTSRSADRMGFTTRWSTAQLRPSSYWNAKTWHGGYSLFPNKSLKKVPLISTSPMGSCVARERRINSNCLNELPGSLLIRCCVTNLNILHERESKGWIGGLRTQA